MSPTPAILHMSLKGMSCNCLLYIIPQVSTKMVMINLYHTSIASLSKMSFPNTAVKPAKKIAVCNCINAFFITGKDRGIEKPTSITRL